MMISDKNIEESKIIVISKKLIKEALVDMWCRGFNCGANPILGDDCDEAANENIDFILQHDTSTSPRN